MMTAVSSIARPVTSMTGHSGCRAKSRLAKSSSSLHVLAQRVVRLGGHAELPQARLADLAELLETDGEPDDAILRRLLELVRRRHAEHERQVGDLEPALREDRRERRLRRARDADEHEIRLLEVARLLAVVALHRELDRLDAAEILLGEREHAARHVDRLAIEEVPQLADERADDVDRVDLELGRSRRGCTRAARGSPR